MNRTLINEIVPETEIKISGWVERIRESKNMMFLVIRDITGRIQVTIENGVIANIEVLDYGNDDEAYVNMAVGVIDAMLETQSSEVDAVSGATFSSNGIKAAVAEALQEAEGE